MFNIDSADTMDKTEALLLALSKHLTGTASAYLEECARIRLERERLALEHDKLEYESARIRAKDMLTPTDVQFLTGWGQTKVSQAMHSESFPLSRDGRSIFVLTDAFYEWLNQTRVPSMADTFHF